MDEFPDLLNQIDLIEQTSNGGYRIPDASRAFWTKYLARYGFKLALISDYQELIAALRYCNAQDFEKLIQQPAPEPKYKFLWNRLRKLGKES